VKRSSRESRSGYGDPKGRCEGRKQVAAGQWTRRVHAVAMQEKRTRARVMQWSGMNGAGGWGELRDVLEAQGGSIDSGAAAVKGKLQVDASTEQGKSRRERARATAVVRDVGEWRLHSSIRDSAVNRLVTGVLGRRGIRELFKQRRRGTGPTTPIGEGSERSFLEFEYDGG
jgi:hypothetical protein